jgi:glycosyltransferase involved in cell wall biosynthesis
MRFTVITPTYNRAHTLGQVYQSLCAQTFHDFEWVIVDDGSTDGTKELVLGWKPFFPIRYLWKPNGGKHTAMNQGVKKAIGEFVLFFDSDDRCVPETLERFDYHWRQIPDPSRFATLSCLCCRPDGSIVGDPYPASSVDAFTFADQYRYRFAERWGIVRTDCLREFPLIEGEPYCPEGLVWDRISRKYFARFFNEPLRIYETGSDSITHRMIKLRASSPKAIMTYYRELALSSAPLWYRLRAAINYCRFAAITTKRRLARSLRWSRGHPLKAGK